MAWYTKNTILFGALVLFISLFIIYPQIILDQQELTANLLEPKQLLASVIQDQIMKPEKTKAENYDSDIRIEDPSVAREELARNALKSENLIFRDPVKPEKPNYANHDSDIRTEDPPPAIPHNLVFMYKYNILESDDPSTLLFKKNIQHTVDEYESLWGGAANTIFLDDAACESAIRDAGEPKLVPYFWEVTVGSFMADICRVAALYNTGGYYFDIDMLVVKPLNLSRTTTFSTVNGNGDFFQAFIAASPRHPVPKRALGVMLEVFEGKRKKRHNLGPTTLKEAFTEVDTDERGEVRLLEEIQLDTKRTKGLYENFPRQNGTSCCCNFIVHEPINHQKTGEIYFFSRFAGSGGLCRLPT